VAVFDGGWTTLENLQPGRTKTYYAREAILQYLDDLEDIYFAEKALAEIRSGRSKPIPIEKVMRRYGLER